MIALLNNAFEKLKVVSNLVPLSFRGIVNLRMICCSSKNVSRCGLSSCLHRLITSLQMYSILDHPQIPNIGCIQRNLAILLTMPVSTLIQNHDFRNSRLNLNPHRPPRPFAPV